MNQTKNDFLNNNGIETHIWYCNIMHQHQELHQYCFTQNKFKLALYKRIEFISIKENDEYECHCWCALWTSMLNMWVSFLEITMLHKTYEKKQGISFTVLSLKHAHCRFACGSFISNFHHKTLLWFWSGHGVKYKLMQHSYYEIHYRIYTVTLSWRFLHCIVVLCNCLMKMDSQV